MSLDDFILEKWKKQIKLVGYCIDNMGLNGVDVAVVKMALLDKALTPLVYLVEEFDKREKKKELPKNNNKTVITSSKDLEAAYEKLNQNKKAVTDISMADVQSALASYLDMLTFWEAGDVVVVRNPKRLETDVWRAITDIVKTEFAGEWISDRENSRWEIKL